MRSRTEKTREYGFMCKVALLLVLMAIWRRTCAELPPENVAKVEFSRSLLQGLEEGGAGTTDLPPCGVSTGLRANSNCTTTGMPSKTDGESGPDRALITPAAVLGVLAIIGSLAVMFGCLCKNAENMRKNFHALQQKLGACLGIHAKLTDPRPNSGSSPVSPPVSPPRVSQEENIHFQPPHSPYPVMRGPPDRGPVDPAESKHLPRPPPPARNRQRLNRRIKLHSTGHASQILGQGAFGTVETGIFIDKSGEAHQVAVKYGTQLFQLQTPESVLSTFQDELDMMARVPVHENIVRCYGGRVEFEQGEEFGERDVYIVEELMHSSLHAVIYGKDFTFGLPYHVTLQIALEVATGIGHLHNSGVIHYDLKPGNILLDVEFHAKIADFGSSKVKAETYMTATVRGTLNYMAPEVLLSPFFGDDFRVTEKLDIYSFGVVLWEMWEGRPPRDGLGREDSTSMGKCPTANIGCGPGHIPNRFTFKRRCPEGLRRLIEDCLNIEKKYRPSASAIRIRLEELIAKIKNNADPTVIGNEVNLQSDRVRREFLG